MWNIFYQITDQRKKKKNLPDYIGLERLYHVILERIIRGNNINKYLLVALPKIFDLVTVLFRYFCFPAKHGFKKRKWVHFKP